MKRIRNHVNPLSFRHKWEELRLSNYFENEKKPLDIEIGFGRGVFIQAYAKEHQHRNILGIEVRKALVENLEKKATETLDNLKVFHGNGVAFVQNALQDKSLEKVFIFHPDPWFKKRQQKRRVINHEFCTILKKKLKKDGRVYISTDVKELWDYQKECMEKNNFVCIDKDVFWQTLYKSHWANFSLKENRESYHGTFQLLRTGS
ncbi:MAG: tRNA (guanosine(46)-N7)-methyltransferase TrmB [bacterium]